MSSILKRREIPIILAAFCGFFVIFDYYFVHGSAAVTSTVKNINDTAGIVAVYALIVGAISAFLHYGREAVKREKEWWLRIWAMFLIVLIPIIAGAGVKEAIYWFTLWIEIPANATMAAIAMLLYLSACYRSFRIRSFETFLLMIGGIIIMLMNAPLWGETLIPWIRPVGTWIRDYAYNGVNRAIVIGTGLAAVITAARTYVGKERAVLLEAAPGE